ncbi:MAG: cyclomaltodextrinase C-terminal domain-containing protein, partial [Bacteroidetes bacterium]|nr:cyclomaltodextrinase C-terminal domain-containing protein [Bacteroidota bacterium]
NHVDPHHFLFEDLPDSTWFHFWPTYTQSNFKASTLYDPYASEYDRKKFNEGWFVEDMPDFDQDNPFLATYLIQNTIWWVEQFDLHGIRIDTYTYPDQSFMKKLNKAMLDNYPDMALFGETWVHQTTTQSYFVGNSRTRGGDDNYHYSVTDFQVAFGIRNAVTEDFGWTEGVSDLYYALAKDVVYPEPEKHVTFFDNHDLERLYGIADKNLDKLHQGIALLMTLRGTPCLLYGTELLMAGTENHGKIREDMPGGWKGDSIDKFNSENWSTEERATIELIQNLQQCRTENQDLFNQGKMVQFIPNKGVYAYGRIHNGKTLLVILNTGREEHSIDYGKYKELIQNKREAQNIVTQELVQLKTNDKLAASGFVVLFFD